MNYDYDNFETEDKLYNTNGNYYENNNQINKNIKSEDEMYDKHKLSNDHLIKASNNNLAAQIETKNIRIKELNKQLNTIINENSELKIKEEGYYNHEKTQEETIANLELEKQKLETLFFQKESELLNNISNLEIEVNYEF